MSTEDLERYEAEIELQLYKEYKDVAPMFSFVVETERRFYLANEVTKTVHDSDGRTYVELQMRDAWVWDMYRTTRFVAAVTIVTFKDVNIEELPEQGDLSDRSPPRPRRGGRGTGRRLVPGPGLPGRRPQLALQGRRARPRRGPRPHRSSSSR